MKVRTQTAQHQQFWYCSLALYQVQFCLLSREALSFPAPGLQTPGTIDAGLWTPKLHYCISQHVENVLQWRSLRDSVLTQWQTELETAGFQFPLFVCSNTGLKADVTFCRCLEMGYIAKLESGASSHIPREGVRSKWRVWFKQITHQKPLLPVIIETGCPCLSHSSTSNNSVRHTASPKSEVTRGMAYDFRLLLTWHQWQAGFALLSISCICVSGVGKELLSALM